MVCAPDLWSAGGPDQSSGIALAGQRSLIEHCEERGDRMAILDAPPGLSPTQVHRSRTAVAGYDSRFAALYYPVVAGVRRAGRLGAAGPAVRPHRRGLGANGRHGRHGRIGTAPRPAINELVRGVVGVGWAVTRADHDLLDSAGVNCVRPFLGRGVRVWGARTVSTEPAWRDARIGRLVNRIRTAVQARLEAALDEPAGAGVSTGAPPEQRLLRSLRAYLFDLWLAGALVGETVDQAFSVRCGRQGAELVCDVALAPVRAGDFTGFRLVGSDVGVAVAD